MTARTLLPHWPPRPSLNILVLVGLLQALDLLLDSDDEATASARHGVTLAARAFAEELSLFFHDFKPEFERDLTALEERYLARERPS